MTVKGLRFCLLCLALTASWASAASDGTSNDNKVTVAVASNFLSTMKQLVDIYQKDTGRVVRLSSGSTGKHYAQILHGAPFDLFFAADELRPKLLEDKDIGVKGSRFTYAEGSLVIWSPEIPTSNSPAGTSLSREVLKNLLLHSELRH